MTFIVKDLQRSRRYYVDRLGLPIVEEAPNAYVMIRTGGTLLCIDQETADQAALGGGASLILFAHDLDAAEAVLKGSGVPYRPGNDRDHGRYLLLIDPDGYTLSISQRSR